MGEWQQPEGSIARVRRPRRGEGTVRASISRSVKNLPILVPSVDWAKIIVGEKSMFRCYSVRHDVGAPVVPADTLLPRPCILYSARHNAAGSRRWEVAPGVVLSHRMEPLGAISPEDLVTEGFEFLNAFKWYWKRRHQKVGWRPWDQINVLEVRPLVHDADRTWAATWLYRQLFEGFAE